MINDNIPQWLKEVLNRGFKPKKIYHNLDKYLFGYIDPLSTKLIKIPNTKIFTLEGLPGSGKTSTWNHFKKDKKILRIRQILPVEPKFDQAMRQSFYFRSDELKTKKCLKSNKQICLLDRYYVSTLAFYWAYDKIHKTKTYKIVFDWYKKSLQKRKLFKPFFVCYINTSLNTSLKRKNRIASIKYDNLWLNKRFLRYFNNYYNYFYKNIEPQTKIIKLSGDKLLHVLIENIKLKIYGKN